MPGSNCIPRQERKNSLSQILQFRETGPHSLLLTRRDSGAAGGGGRRFVLLFDWEFVSPLIASNVAAKPSYA